MAPSKNYSVVAGKLLLLCMVAVCPTLADAQPVTASRRQAIAQWSPAREIDKSKLARGGFRVLEGKHITLVTDLEPAPGIDELPAVVDLAIAELANRFDIDLRSLNDWRVLGMLIRNREKFAAAGLMPAGHEEFPDGLSIGYELWVVDQPSDYYRRHLLLHELTHSFMATQLGSCGPGWYMEGMAELLGTHRWESRKLTLAVMPPHRESALMWGRTKLVNQAVAENRLLAIPAVMKIDNRQALEVESYAWVWALAKFLDTHPAYQHRFRDLQLHTLDPDFNQRFRKTFADDWWQLNTEWQLYIRSLDYGYDIPREAIDWASTAAAKPVATTLRVSVSAEQGWQPTGILLEAGNSYELKASGRYVVGSEPDGTPWPCEPGGITLRYYNRRPIGKLIAAVVDRSGTPGNGLVEPVSVGLGTRLEPEQSGELFLRMNDSPAELAENRGSANLSIRRLP